MVRAKVPNGEPLYVLVYIRLIYAYLSDNWVLPSRRVPVIRNLQVPRWCVKLPAIESNKLTKGHLA